MNKRLLAILLTASLCLTGCTAIRNKKSYGEAQELLKAGEYLHAAAVFDALGEYEDSAAQAVECRYLYALAVYESEDWMSARTSMTALDGYKDSDALATECSYQIAKNWFEQGDFESAQVEFTPIIEYSDSARYLELIEARLHGWDVFLAWITANSVPDGDNLILETHTVPENETSYLLLNPSAGDLFFNLYIEGSDGVSHRTALCIHGPDAGLILQTDYRFEGTPVYAEGTARADVAALRPETEVLLDSYSDYYRAYDTELYSEDLLLGSCRNGVKRMLEVFPEIFEGFGTDVLYKDLGVFAMEE